MKVLIAGDFCPQNRVAALFDEGLAPNNDLTDPFLDSDEFAREIRSQGERLNGKIAQMMIK